MYSDYFLPFNKECFLHEFGGNKLIEMNLMMQEYNLKNKIKIYNHNNENFNYREQKQ